MSGMIKKRPREIPVIDKKASDLADVLADKPYGQKKIVKSNAIFKRCNFSLTEELSETIDDLTAITKRISRSDVVKASLGAFKELSKEEQISELEKVKEKH